MFYIIYYYIHIFAADHWIRACNENCIDEVVLGSQRLWTKVFFRNDRLESFLNLALTWMTPSPRLITQSSTICSTPNLRLPQGCFKTNIGTNWTPPSALPVEIWLGPMNWPGHSGQPKTIPFPFLEDSLSKKRRNRKTQTFRCEDKPDNILMTPNNPGRRDKSLDSSPRATVDTLIS